MQELQRLRAQQARQRQQEQQVPETRAQFVSGHFAPNPLKSMQVRLGVHFFNVTECCSLRLYFEGLLFVSVSKSTSAFHRFPLPDGDVAERLGSGSACRVFSYEAKCFWMDINGMQLRSKLFQASDLVKVKAGFTHQPRLIAVDYSHIRRYTHYDSVTQG